MDKHTPGPWIAWDDGRSIGIEGPNDEIIQIAEVVDHGDMTSESQMLADQGLIAAAPAMLAALQEVEKNDEIMRLLQRQIDGKGEHICGLIRQAITAAGA